MISKLPRWIWVGGWVLAYVAGMANVVGLMGFEHLAVSHLTATTSRLSVAVVQGDTATLRLLGAIVISFVLGAMISGWLVRSSALELGRHYTSALLLESMLLFGASVSLERHDFLGICMLCCACGLQNALASNYSGAIIRTTHLTGIFTDLGVILGRFARGAAIDWRRLLLFVLLVSGYSAGGATSALAFPRLGYITLLIPASITGLAAITYWAYQRRATRGLNQADI